MVYRCRVFCSSRKQLLFHHLIRCHIVYLSMNTNWNYMAHEMASLWRRKKVSFQMWRRRRKFEFFSFVFVLFGFILFAFICPPEWIWIHERIITNTFLYYNYCVCIPFNSILLSIVPHVTISQWQWHWLGLSLWIRVIVTNNIHVSNCKCKYHLINANKIQWNMLLLLLFFDGCNKMK